MDDLGKIFPEFEKCKYSIKLFKSTQEIEKIGLLNTELKRQKKKIRISSIFKIFDKGLVEETEVVVDNKNFNPTEYNAIFKKNDKSIKCIGKYGKKKLLIEVITNKKSKKFKIPLKGLYFDNSTIFYVARAFALNRFRKGRFNAINVLYGVTTPVTLEISGDEILKLDVKEYSCKVVKLNFESDNKTLSQRLYYDKKHPNLLIKNVLGPQVIELEEKCFSDSVE